MAKSIHNPNDFVTADTVDPRVTLTANEARQGGLGKPVLYVLICSVLLAFVAWGAAEYFGMSIAPAPADLATEKSPVPTINSPAGENGTVDGVQQPSQTIKDPSKI